MNCRQSGLEAAVSLFLLLAAKSLFRDWLSQKSWLLTRLVSSGVLPRAIELERATLELLLGVYIQCFLDGELEALAFQNPGRKLLA
jgi:hypothetical protein